MKALVLAEKPSVARDIARVLGCHRNLPGAIEGPRYIVTWALGHLVTLADPEAYDPRFKEWKMDYLPMVPAKWELVVIRQTAKQYGHVKAQLFRKDVDQIIIATDAGREGELVARWILDRSGCHKPVKRLWISSVTDKAIREGFAHLKEGREYDNLYHAARSRAEADWLVGINATRALTCKYNAQLSCGRVQTPTLAIIARRGEEIRTLSPGILSALPAWPAASPGPGGIRKTAAPVPFRRIGRKAGKRAKGTVPHRDRLWRRSPRKQYAPGLYDLTELQRDANLRFRLFCQGNPEHHAAAL